MSEKSAIYDRDPHTKAKHDILRAYLNRWLPILDRQSAAIRRTEQRLLYFDGFAGAGVYTGNVPGSPLVAIDAAMKHSHAFACPIEIRLVEQNAERCSHLSKLMRERRQSLLSTSKLSIMEPIQGDCQTEVNKFIDECERNRRSLGPAFFFLDQFGYSAFSMELVARILSHQTCEVFSYLNWSMLHPWMTDSSKHGGITKAFGGDEWQAVMDLSGRQKEERFREIYLDALRGRGGAKYAYPFEMRDNSDRVLYWLFFSTNSIRGLEEMKTAMWEVDGSGGFQFSDKFTGNRSSMFDYTDRHLSKQLVAALDGKSMTVAELSEYALTHTPACRFRDAFGLMEREGHLKPLDPPAGRTAGSFRDHAGMRVEIRRVLKQQSLFGN